MTIVYDSTIRDRYAQALLAVARKQGITDKLISDMEDLRQMSAPKSKLRDFLNAPQIPTEAKLRLFEHAFKDRVSPLFYRLLMLLMEKGRIEYTGPILEQFKRLVDRERGIYEANVSTAVPLDDSQKKKLQEALERHTKHTLRISYMVDPALIGGVKFTYGDHLIDDSVKGKLHKLRQQLHAAADA